MNVYFTIVSFVIGMVFGSFYNVCIYRLPFKKSIVNPPSHCYNCNTRLKPLDLVPVFSFVFLRGKCRYCSTKISKRYAGVEILTGLLFVGIYLSFGYDFKTLYYMILTSILILITFIDIDHYIIPDSLILIGSVVAVIINIFGVEVGFIEGIKGSLFIGGGVLVVALIIEFIIKKEVIGGGDIKLYWVIGLVLGVKLSLVTLMLSIYIGGLYGVILIIYNKYKKRELNSVIPFGPFIAVAAYISMIYGSKIVEFYISYF